MEPIFTFDYSDWRSQQDVEDAPLIVETESEAEADVEEDVENNVYEYQPMKEPEQAYTIQPGLAVYPTQGTYAQPQQVQFTQPTPKPAPAPAPVQAPVTYQYPYPYAAYPVVGVMMPNYPVPVPEPREPAGKTKDKAKVKEAEKKEANKPRAWVGRTKKQVDEDNLRIAINEGVFKPNDMVPKDAKDDQFFWCIEPDSTHTLRTFRTVEDDLYPGKWKVDPSNGVMYFVREKEKKK